MELSWYFFFFDFEFTVALYVQIFGVYTYNIQTHVFAYCERERKIQPIRERQRSISEQFLSQPTMPETLVKRESNRDPHALNGGVR